MNRMSACVVAFLAAAIASIHGIALAEPKPSTSTGNADAAKAARAVVEQGLATVERMEVEAFRAIATPDLIAFDMDLEAKPVRMGSLNDAIAYVEAITAEAKKMGATLKFENVKSDVHTTSDMAYCLVDYDFAATMPDGSRTVQPSRTTVVLTKVDGAWKWAHWHTSLSAPMTTSAKK